MSDLKLFTELTKDWQGACQRKDRATISQYLADDFKATTVSSNGQLTSREDWINYVLDANATNGIREITEVRRHGDFAVVNLIMTFTGDWNDDFLMTDIWHLVNGDWKVLHRHNSYVADAISVRTDR